MHASLEPLFKVGTLPSRTVSDPGVHGICVAGRQGMGVSAPRAADVAEATAGLAGLRQKPKGRMLTIGR